MNKLKLILGITTSLIVIILFITKIITPMINMRIEINNLKRDNEFTEKMVDKLVYGIDELYDKYGDSDKIIVKLKNDVEWLKKYIK